MLGRFPGKGQIAAFAVGGAALRGYLPAGRVFGNFVPFLHQHPAGDGAQFRRRGGRRGSDSQNPQIALAPQNFQRLRFVAGGGHHFIKHRPHRFGDGGGDRAVESHDAAESAHRVALVGQFVGGGQVVAAGQPAGVVVLYHRRRRLGEIRHGAPGGIGVQQIVVRQLPPVQLLGPGQPGQRGAGRGVQRARLMRIFAVAQPGHFRQRKLPKFWQRAALVGPAVAAQVAGNAAVVERHMAKGFGRQLPPFLRRQAARQQLGGHPIVIAGVDHHRHRGEILGRRPQHRRPADVDVFQRLIQRNTGAADGVGKGIEVDRHQIDGGDAVSRQFRHLFGRIPARQQPAVNRRMQRLDPPVQDFRRAGNGGHRRHRQPALAGQGAMRAAGADELKPGLRQLPGEIHHPGFVIDTDERFQLLLSPLTIPARFGVRSGGFAGIMGRRFCGIMGRRFCGIMGRP